jgi:hypothetical protein
VVIKANGTQSASADLDAYLETAEQLQAVEFEAAVDIVPGLGLIPGCFLLIGVPKVGKSFLALELAIAVATGGVCLGGICARQGSCLYLVLEGGRARHQRRIRRLLGEGAPWPAALSHATQWPTGVDATGLIERWCDRRPDRKLVVVDVLEKFRGRSRGYSSDFEVVSALSELAERRGIVVLVIHHTRKARAADLVSEVSGPQALAAGVDGVLVLKAVGGSEFSLTSGMRDAPVEQMLRWSSETCRFAIAGEAAKEVRQDDEQKIVDFLALNPEAAFSTAQITTHGGLTGSKPAIWKMLSRMAKAAQIAKPRHDRYQCISASGRQDDGLNPAKSAENIEQKHPDIDPDIDPDKPRRQDPKRGRNGGRKPILGKVTLSVHKEQHAPRVSIGVSRDVIDGADLRGTVEIGIARLNGAARTRLRITKGAGYRWADPQKPLRHIRFGSDRLSELAGYTIPKQFRPLDLSFTVARGALTIQLPTPAEIKRASR